FIDNWYLLSFVELLRMNNELLHIIEAQEKSPLKDRMFRGELQYFTAEETIRSLITKEDVELIDYLNALDIWRVCNRFIQDKSILEEIWLSAFNFYKYLSILHS